MTYVAGAGSPMLEHDEPDTASFRMLGVDPAAQGQGVGRALVQACLQRAMAAGRGAVVLHTTTSDARRPSSLRRLGFVRDESIDWDPVPGICLMATASTCRRTSRVDGHASLTRTILPSLPPAAKRS